MAEKVVVLGTPHTGDTPGKRSPDGRFREAVYGRRVVAEVKRRLEAEGVRVFVDYEPLEPRAEWKAKSVVVEQSRELQYRVKVVNDICARYGAGNCIFVSVHTDACPGGGWQSARGLSVRVSPKASERSKVLARTLYEAGAKRGLAGNRSVPKCGYWVQSLYVLNKTACAAALTETLFQNNREDVDFLLSEEGFEAVVGYHVEGIVRFLGLKG